MPAPAKRSAPSASSRRQRTPKASSRTRQRISAPQSSCSTCNSSTDRAGISFSTETGSDNPGAELEHLQDAARGQVCAAQSGRKTDEVLDPRRAAGLPARSEPVEHQGGNTFRRCVHGGGNARGTGADNRQIDLLRRTMFPDAGLAGQLLQGRVHENSPVATFDHRRLLRRAQRRERTLALLGFRVEPRKGDEVLVEKFADRVRIAAASRTDDAQSKRAQLRQELSPTRKRGDQLFAKTRYAIQQGPELAARNAQQTRLAPRHAGHNHRTAGEKVDVSGELPGLMSDDHPVAVRRILDFDLAGFNNIQIDIRLTGSKDGLAIGVLAGGNRKASPVRVPRR